MTNQPQENVQDIVVTIAGPTAAGKTTVATILEHFLVNYGVVVKNEDIDRDPEALLTTVMRKVKALVDARRRVVIRTVQMNTRTIDTQPLSAPLEVAQRICDVMTAADVTVRSRPSGARNQATFSFEQTEPVHFWNSPTSWDSRTGERITQATSQEHAGFTVVSHDGRAYKVTVSPADVDGK